MELDFLWFNCEYPSSSMHLAGALSTLTRICMHAMHTHTQQALLEIAHTKRAHGNECTVGLIVGGCGVVVFRCVSGYINIRHRVGGHDACAGGKHN